MSEPPHSAPTSGPTVRWTGPTRSGTSSSTCRWWVGWCTTWAPLKSLAPCRGSARFYIHSQQIDWIPRPLEGGFLQFCTRCTCWSRRSVEIWLLEWLHSCSKTYRPRKEPNRTTLSSGRTPYTPPSSNPLKWLASAKSSCSALLNSFDLVYRFLLLRSDIPKNQSWSPLHPWFVARIPLSIPLLI